MIIGSILGGIIMMFSGKGVGEPIGHKLIIAAFGKVAEMYPELAGEYGQVLDDGNEGPAWQHIEHSALRLDSTGQRWTLKENTTEIARSPVTAKNVLESSSEWEYYDSSTEEWIQGFGDVYINMAPDDDGKDEDVLLITGGWNNGEELSSVEIFDPSNSSLACTLPNITLPEEYDHMVVGLIMWQSLRKGMMRMGVWNGIDYNWNGASFDVVETLQDDGSYVTQDWKLKPSTR